MMTERAFKRYCDRVRDSGEWGGEPEVSPLRCPLLRAVR